MNYVQNDLKLQLYRLTAMRDAHFERRDHTRILLKLPAGCGMKNRKSQVTGCYTESCDIKRTLVLFNSENKTLAVVRLFSGTFIIDYFGHFEWMAPNT